MWPMILDYTKDECVRLLRELELNAYEEVVTAFRAQGNLTAEKRQLLNDLRDFLSISIERHQAEIRRAASDEKLATIAHLLAESSEDTSSEWLDEGKRLIPLLPRLVPQTALYDMANSLAESQSESNERMPPPAATGRKRRADDPALEIGKKLKEESITIRRKVTPSTPEAKKKITAPSRTNQLQKQMQQPLDLSQLQSISQQLPKQQLSAGHRPLVPRPAGSVPSASSSATANSSSSAGSRVIFVQSMPPQAQQPCIQKRSPTAISNNSSSSSHMSASNAQQLKQLKSGQPVVLVSASSLQRMTQSPASSSSQSLQLDYLSPLSLTTSPSNSASMSRVNQTAAQLIYQTAKNCNTGKSNLFILPCKGSSSNLFLPGSTSSSDSNGIILSSTNHKNIVISGTSCSTSRPQVVSLSASSSCSSDKNSRSKTAQRTMLVDKRVSIDRGRDEVNGSGGKNSSSATAASVVLNNNHHKGSPPNQQRNQNVIEIQASGEVMESLKKKGQLSQDIIALVQKAVSMAGVSGNSHRTQIESQSSHVRSPNLPTSALISASVNGEPKCDVESAIDPE